MNAEQLLQHFERISEAPDAIPRLRRFILDLAVRGKLVEQDPNDEPAAELLKRIAEEKARLVKAGEIKKLKKLQELLEVPFGLPKNWLWTRIREVTSDRGQEIPQSKFTYIDVTAIDKEAGVVAEPKILEATEAPSRARKKTKRGDVIYSCVRPYLLNVAIIDTDFEPEPIASTAFAILNGHGLVLPRYLWVVLRSPFMVKCVEKNQRGQAYPAINDADFAVLPLPLPPLAEQHSIIARVDELMILCDQLEAARVEQEQCRDSLVVASLQGLNQPAEEEETFREHARFIFNILPRITTRAAHIKRLRQTILNLAVRGRLVPQDPTDEPAVELLKRISAEKARLVKEGKIKRPPTVESVDTTNASFILPESWVWVRMGEVYDVRDGTHDSPRYQEDGYPLITSKDFVDGKISFDNCKYISKEDHDKISQRSKVDVGDILFSMIGGNIGNMVLVNAGREFSIKNVALFKYFSLDLSLPSFLKVVLKNLSESVQQKAIGGAQPFVSLGFLRGALIGLPPLAEQHRIVAKVDELMVICDQLEAQITVTEQDSRRFLEAVLNEALSPALVEVE